MTTTYASIEEYAEHVRQECNRIMGASLAGSNNRAGELAAALCTEAAGIVQGRKMQQEQQGGADRYDLAALRADTTSPTDSENPFEDD